MVNYVAVALIFTPLGLCAVAAEPGKPAAPPVERAKRAAELPAVAEAHAAIRRANNDYAAAKKQARADYKSAKARCERQTAEARSTCIKDARAARKKTIAGAKAARDSAIDSAIRQARAKARQ